MEALICSFCFNLFVSLQIAALTPVADAAQQFTEEYRSFATAVDTTRHELPVKNLHIEGDRREFLGQWSRFSTLGM